MTLLHRNRKLSKARAFIPNTRRWSIRAGEHDDILIETNYNFYYNEQQMCRCRAVAIRLWHFPMDNTRRSRSFSHSHFLYARRIGSCLRSSCVQRTHTTISSRMCVCAGVCVCVCVSDRLFLSCAHTCKNVRRWPIFRVWPNEMNVAACYVGWCAWTVNKIHSQKKFFSQIWSVRIGPCHIFE